MWGEEFDPGNFPRKTTVIFDRVENESVRPLQRSRTTRSPVHTNEARPPATVPTLRRSTRDSDARTRERIGHLACPRGQPGTAEDLVSVPGDPLWHNRTIRS